MSQHPSHQSPNPQNPACDTADLAAETGSLDATKQANQPSHLRDINTFMKRRTHMNKQAQQALGSAAYASYLLNGLDADLSQLTDLRACFADSKNGSDAPLTLEIGFGMGDSLLQMAQDAPNQNFIGIEVHEPGIGRCAYLANERELRNLKLINGDAIALLKQLPEAHIDTIQLYFPDPWQKKRHYKRRFVSPERMQLVTSRLREGGIFHAATDWAHYAFWMLEVLDHTQGLVNTQGRGNFTPRPAFRPMTKFERRGIASGHGVWDLMYRKHADS